MNAQFSQLLATQTSLQSQESFRPQNHQWISSIRKSLGMTTVAAAKRAGVSPAAWSMAEKREREQTITLETLKKFLKALDCELQYRPVPKVSLEKMIATQVRKAVQDEVRALNATMMLEGQGLSDAFCISLVERRIQETL